jgi:SAM-dependent methyltransferase
MVGHDRRAMWNANAPAWTEMSRAGFDIYRDLVNTPAFFAMLPPIDDRTGLDVGCGEGHNTRLLAARGAHLVALDIADVFVTAAAASTGPGVEFVIADAATLPLASRSFHFVTAFMSLMDVGDPEATLDEMARVLEPGGFVQFSIVHPATATPIRRWMHDESGRREALAIGDYFVEGPLTERWTFGMAPAAVRERHEPFTITYARRTLAGWFNAVAAAGLAIEAVAEPHADEQTARDHPEVADTRIAPYFLIVRARKPLASTPQVADVLTPPAPEVARARASPVGPRRGGERSAGPPGDHRRLHTGAARTAPLVGQRQ